MLEKVAKIIGDHFYADVGPDTTPELWESCVDAARAVLKGMRDPSADMIEAGMDYDERETEIRLGRPPTVEECQAGEWAAMIDEALKG